MSSILKALKKLEHEQATNKPGQIKIDSRILQERSKPGLSRIKTTICVLVLLMAGSSFTYIIMKRSAPDSTSVANRNSVSLPVETMQQLDNNLQSDRKTSGKAPIEHDSAPPQSFKKPEIPVPMSSKSSPALPAMQSPIPPATIVTPKVTEPPQTPPKNLPTNVSAARPNLTVNGIAFQDEGSENLAVINGVTVTRGSIIEGVKVEEILNDRVRLSQGGERFEIILHKSNK